MLLFNLPRVCEHLTQHHREMHLPLKCVSQVKGTLVPWPPTAGGAGKGATATQRTKDIHPWLFQTLEGRALCGWWCREGKRWTPRSQIRLPWAWVVGSKFYCLDWAIICWGFSKNSGCFGSEMGEKLQIATANPAQMGCICDLILRRLFANPLEEVCELQFSIWE